MIACALHFRQVCLQFSASYFNFFFKFQQAIDIFMSRHPDITNYRLSAEDWIQVEAFAKILEV